MPNTNILVVDDTPANLELLEIILHSYGYEVRTAISGEGALRAVEAQLPSLILLDVMMPELDGFETCRRLKADKKTAAIPVIFLSAKNSSQDIVEGFAAGGVDYVGKPFSEAELLSRVKTHIALYTLQKEVLIQKKELERNQYDLQKSLEVVNAHIIYAKTDGEGNFVEVSDAFCRAYGYGRSELIGVNNKILKCKETPEQLHKELWQNLKAGKSWRGEYKNRRKDGSEFWVEGYIEPTYNADGTFLCYSAIYYDINDKKRIETLSITDQMTGLYNRRHFEAMLPIEFKRSGRSGAKLLFVTLDIDFFKQYNDTYGHQEGDGVLIAMGSALKKVLNREDDLVFRLGGEEFGAVCSIDSASSATIMAEKIRAAVEGMQIPHSGNQVSAVVTASVGAVCIDFSAVDKEAISVDTVYKIADNALYAAKREGRNRVKAVNYGEYIP